MREPDQRKAKAQYQNSTDSRFCDFDCLLISLPPRLFFFLLFFISRVTTLECVGVCVSECIAGVRIATGVRVLNGSFTSLLFSMKNKSSRNPHFASADDSNVSDFLIWWKKKKGSACRRCSSSRRLLLSLCTWLIYTQSSVNVLPQLCPALDRAASKRCQSTQLFHRFESSMF